MTRNVVLSANTSWYLYNFRRSTIRALQQRGLTVVCLSPQDDYSQKLVGELSCEWHDLAMDNQGSNPVKDLLVFWQLWRFYRRFKPCAAIHFTIKNNVYGTWAARLANVPSINNVSGLGTAFLHRGPVALVVRVLYKTSFPFAAHVFCQNHEDYTLLVENGLVAPQKLGLLPGSGVDAERFHPRLKCADETDGIFRFLYAGRMLADKGLFELVDAMDLLIARGLRCELELCGFLDVQNITAISRAQMNQWCERDYVRYLGSSDSMEQVYAGVDCVVLPSYREGMPRSLLEAGAMALPVVATDVPGCRNIIEHGVNGLLCAVKSAESLADAMAQCLTLSAEARASLGSRGRIKVETEFSEAIVVEKTLAAITVVTA